jgi:hypothetical protein
LDEIGDIGFYLYQKIDEVPIKRGDTLLIGLGDKQIQRKVRKIAEDWFDYDEKVPEEYWNMPVTTTYNINITIGISG